MSDSTLWGLESVLVSAALLGWILYTLERFLRRTRPELRVGVPLIVGTGLRLAAIAAVSTTSIAQTLRGGDELGFLAQARSIADTSLSSDQFINAAINQLHVWLFAVQFKVADFTVAGLRITQVTLAMVGLLLMVVAVYDMAGPRVARLLAWAIALEPSNIFFNGILHKEALMTLAGGLFLLGATHMWRHLTAGGLLTLITGCLIGVATRPYAGLFLAAAGVVVALHAGLVHIQGKALRSIPLLMAVVIIISASIPALLQATTSQNLKETIQSSQNANSNDTSNLSLERVDFSSRTAIITNLPRRMYDLTFKPYPWQVQNTSQRFGLLGTLVTLGTLALLISSLIRSWGTILRRAGPMLYPLLMLFVAYSLSAGNAGTGFRYRSHLVVLAFALIAVLRGQTAEAPVPETDQPQALPWRRRAPLRLPRPRPAASTAGGAAGADWFSGPPGQEPRRERDRGRPSGGGRGR